MPGLLHHLEPAQRRALLDDLNYLNLGEIRGFCRTHGVPFAIYIETAEGRRRTRDIDRKSVVLDRVRRYLRTGRIPPATCFPRAVAPPGAPPPRFAPSDRLYYGWYDKKNPALLRALADLTDGAFRSGAVARILAREFWTEGKAPTLRQFARGWLRAQARGLGVDRGDHPEAAWLTDRARGTAGPDWKAKRARIARRTLRTLATLPVPE